METCNLVRDTMYKYSKLIKEKMLKDNYIAFMWILYRLLSPGILKVINECREPEVQLGTEDGGQGQRHHILGLRLAGHEDA